MIPRSIDTIRIDINSGQVRKAIAVRKEDTIQRTLNFLLVNNGKPLDLSGLLFAEILIHKADDYEADNGCVIDGDSIQYTLRSSDTSAIGTNVAQLMLTFDNGEVITTPTFEIVVYSKVLDQRTQKSTNEYGAITDQLVQVNELAAEAAVSADNAAASAETAAGVVDIVSEYADSAQEYALTASEAADTAASQTALELNSTFASYKSETAEYATSASEYAGSASEYASTAATASSEAANYAQSTSEYIGSASEYASMASEYASGAENYMTSTSEYVGSASEYAAVAGSQTTQGASYLASTSEYVGTAQSLTTAASEYNNSASEHASYASSEAAEAEGWATQAQQAAQSISGALRPIGTVSFLNLPLLVDADEGDMYNVSDSFETTSDFKEGSGVTVPAGANVYKTSDGKWDILAGTLVTGVKGDSENNYRLGNVNITKSNIGLGNVRNEDIGDTDISSIGATVKASILALFNKFADYQTKLTNPLTKSDVVDNLTTTTTNIPLSANQGKTLDEKIGVLASLVTTAKTNIVDAINECFQYVSNGKAAIASAITDKGVTTAADATFATMATNIGNIVTGITPTGNKAITIDAPGTVSDIDVSTYETASVTTSGLIITPTATKSITSNGAHDVTNYASANVSVNQTPSHSSTSPNNTIYVNLNTGASPASHITAVSSLANTGGGSGSSYDGTCAFYSGTASVNKNGNTITITIPQTLRCGNRFGTSSSYYDVDRTVTVVLTI